MRRHHSHRTPQVRLLRLLILRAWSNVSTTASTSATPTATSAAPTAFLDQLLQYLTALSVVPSIALAQSTLVPTDNHYAIEQARVDSRAEFARVLVTTCVWLGNEERGGRLSNTGTIVDWLCSRLVQSQHRTLLQYALEYVVRTANTTDNDESVPIDQSDRTVVLEALELLYRRSSMSTLASTPTTPLLDRQSRELVESALRHVAHLKHHQRRQRRATPSLPCHASEHQPVGYAASRSSSSLSSPSCGLDQSKVSSSLNVITTELLQFAPPSFLRWWQATEGRTSITSHQMFTWIDIDTDIDTISVVPPQCTLCDMVAQPTDHVVTGKSTATAATTTTSSRLLLLEAVVTPLLNRARTQLATHPLELTADSSAQTSPMECSTTIVDQVACFLLWLLLVERDHAASGSVITATPYYAAPALFRASAGTVSATSDFGRQLEYAGSVMAILEPYRDLISPRIVQAFLRRLLAHVCGCVHDHIVKHQQSTDRAVEHSSRSPLTAVGSAIIRNDVLWLGAPLIAVAAAFGKACVVDWCSIFTESGMGICSRVCCCTCACTDATHAATCHVRFWELLLERVESLESTVIEAPALYHRLCWLAEHPSQPPRARSTIRNLLRREECSVQLRSKPALWLRWQLAHNHYVHHQWGLPIVEQERAIQLMVHERLCGSDSITAAASVTTFLTTILEFLARYECHCRPCSCSG